MIAVEPVKAIAQLTHVILDEPSPDLLLSHIALSTIGALECREIELGLVNTEGFLDIIGSYGRKSNKNSSQGRLPLWTSLPIVDAARTGEIIYFESREQLINSYPILSASKDASSGFLIATPIKYRNIVIGAASFVTNKPPRRVFKESQETDTLLGLLGIYLKNLIDKRSVVTRDFVEAGSSLTARQKKIVQLFQESLTTDQIASRLRFSSSTIKQDIIKIYEIFGVNSRQEVIELAKKAGLLKTETDR